MREDKSFFDMYDEITQKSYNWCYYSQDNQVYTAQDLFEGSNALNFIKSSMKSGAKDSALAILNEPRFRMTRDRSNHTLSAYLFGIALRNGLHIDMKELPRVSSKPTENFLYFWSLTCLCHDVAFAIEYENEDLALELSDVNKFMEYFGVKYSLLDVSTEHKLICKYYQYKVKEYKRIDHGIAGAILFYDALMKSYQQAAEDENVATTKAFEHNGLKYSEEYELHIKLIANTIAKHNMWRASDKDVDIYKKYELFELIPNPKREHILSMNRKPDDKKENDKEKLLFLMGLVDTLEPIKCLGRERNRNRLKNPYIVLEKLKIRLNYKKKEIVITCPKEYLADYYESIRGITTWMNLKLERRDNVIRILIL